MSDRLPGYQLLSKGGFGCSSLWLGEDHLLYVDALGVLLPVRERYRRYAYADIESVVVAPNSMRSTGAVVLGVFVLAAAGCTLSFYFDGPGAGWGNVAVAFAATMLLLASVLLVRHLVRGECCVTEVATRVSRVRPRPLRRLRTARLALHELGERVRQARGAGEGPNQAVTADLNVRPSPRKPRVPATALAAFALAGALALWLALVLWLGWSGSVAAAVSSVLAYASALCLLLALASITRRPAPLESRVLLMALSGPLLLLGLGGLLCFAVFSVLRPDLATGIFGFAQMFGEMRTELPSSVATFMLFMCVAIAVLAGVGLVTASSQRSIGVPPGAGADTPLQSTGQPGGVSAGTS